MAKLTLDIESNAPGLFGQLTGKMDELRSGVDSFGKDGKDSFKKVSDETANLTKSIETGSRQTGDFLGKTQAVGKSASTIRMLRQEMNQYIAAAEKAGQGTKGWTDNLEKAAHAKEKIKELQAVLGGIATNQIAALAQGFATIGQTGVQAFEGVIATQAVFGDKSKEVEETLTKLVALDKLAALAGEFSLIGEKVTQLKVAMAPINGLFTSSSDAIISGYSNANQSLVGFFSNFKGNMKGAFSAAWTFVKEFGANTISVAKNIGTGFVSFFSNFGTNMKAFAGAAKDGIGAIGTALKANPLGIILTVVTLVIGAMVALRDKVKPIGDLFAWVGKAISAIGDELERMGQFLGIIDSESEKMNQKTIDGYEKVKAAIENRYDNEIKLMTAAGKETASKEIEKLNAVREALKQQMIALKYKHDQGKELSKEEMEMFRTGLIEQNNLAFEMVAIKIKAEREAAKKKEEAAKKAADEAKQAAEKQKQLEKDLQQSLLDLAKRAAQAEIDLATGEDKIKRQKDFSKREIDLLKKTIVDKMIAAGEGNKLTSEQEKEFQKLYYAIDKKAADDIIGLEVEKANKLAEQQKKQVDNQIQFLELQERLRIAAVNNAQRPSGVSEELFEMQKQRNILIIQKQSIKEQLELKQKAIDEEANVETIAKQNEILQLFGKNDDLSNIKRKAAEDSIQQIKDQAELEKRVLTEEEKAKLVALDKQIKESTDKINEHGGLVDWQKILGLNDKEFAQLKSGLGKLRDELQTFSNEMFASMQSNLDAELQLNQDKIDSRDKTLSSLEEQLGKENDLRKEGLANNVDAVQKQIDAEKAAREKDLQEQKKLQAEKKKLAKEQFVVDTALQASNLITGVSQIFKTYAAVPYVAAAIAALMIGAFAFTKIKAYQALDNGQKNSFAKGVIGIDGPGTKTSDSIDAKLSKGESVMTADETEDNYDLLMGIRKKDQRLIDIGIDNLLKNTGVGLNRNIPIDLSNRKEEARSAELKLNFVADNKGVEDRLDKLEGHLKIISKPTNKYIDGNGNTIIESGSLTRLIRKSDSFNQKKNE